MENKIPGESETIAVKRIARLAERLRMRSEFSSTRAWWSNGPLELASILFLFILNFYLVYPFFGTEAVQTQYSGPIIPLLANLVELLGLPVTYAIQIVNILFFLLFPITFYFFIKKISGRKIIAVLAVLFASLPFFLFAKLRIQAAFYYIEAPHVAGIALIPVALNGLLTFLREGKVKNLAIASISSALVVLLSPFCFLTFMIFAFFTGFSELLLGKGRLKTMRLVAVFIFAASLTSFWYHPAFFIWMLKSPVGVDIRQTFFKMIPISAFTVPVLGVFGYILFDRKPSLQPVFLAVFYSIIFAMIVFAGGKVLPSHPSRYAIELGLSLSFLLSIVLVKLTDRVRFLNLKNIVGLNQILANASIILILLVMALGIIRGRNDVAGFPDTVLGAWDDVNKGDFWIVRDGFDGISSYLGYLITGVSITFLGYMKTKVKKT